MSPTISKADSKDIVDGLAFTKAHGTGNDFVVIADLSDRIDLSVSLVRALCDRRTGVGADGVIRIGAGSDTAAVFMDYRNADGSIVEMCGNGVRVVAKHVVDHGLVDPDAARRLVLGTRAGVRPVTVHVGADGTVGDVTVDMGLPAFDPVRVPFAATDPHAVDADHHQLSVNGDTVRLAVVSMGNPHAVIEVDDVASAPVGRIGLALQHHDGFPEQVNVGFVQRIDDAGMRLRVYERGVGETMACGTGACAAVAVLQRDGLVGDAVRVDVRGGSLHIATGHEGHLMMTGPATEVAHGTLDSRWLEAVTSGVGPSNAGGQLGVAEVGERE